MVRRTKKHIFKNHGKHFLIKKASYQIEGKIVILQSIVIKRKKTGMVTCTCRYSSGHVS